jgi:hypothetical protein
MLTDALFSFLFILIPYIVFFVLGNEVHRNFVVWAMMLILFCGMLKLALAQLIQCLSYSVNFNIFYHNMFLRSNARAFTYISDGLRFRISYFKTSHGLKLSHKNSGSFGNKKNPI